jgi:hypothetical protein
MNLSELPTIAETVTRPYQSHKRVRARKVDRVLPFYDDSGVTLVFENHVEESIQTLCFTNDQLKNKPAPEAGMYFVLYEDGYFSFSPAKQFEDGYTPAEYVDTAEAAAYVKLLDLKPNSILVVDMEKVDINRFAQCLKNFELPIGYRISICAVQGDVRAAVDVQESA